MLDILRSTKHPLHPAQFHVRIGLHHGFLRRRGIRSSLLIFPVMFQFTFRSHDAKLSMINRVDNLT
jgi:hypothetical protein